MKKSLLYIASLMIAAAGFTSCEGDLEYPPMIVPTATIEANTTIAALKSSVWQTTANYVTTIGTTEENEHIVIAGRVVSSDESGNIFKSVIIQDATAALTIAVNAYDLYQSYQLGQQIVVDLTDLKIGGYNGLLQLGGEGTYNGAPSMTFMDPDLFAAHAQVNGLAMPERIDTALTTIPELTTAKGTVDGLQKWQSRLIRIDGVSFEDAGQPFAGDATANRYVKDSQGNRINVRNSSYADFARDILPAGEGSIVGILSYYGSDWQILLNGVDGCIGFTPAEGPDDPVTPPAEASGDVSAEATCNVAAVIAGATGTDVWVKGYIVGSVTDKDLSSAVFSATPASGTNILIAASADETDITKCVPVQLPAGDVRTALNLSSNPGNYKAEVALKGNLEKYFGTAGVKTVTEFTINGQGSEPVTPPAEASGDGSVESPYNVPAVIGGATGTDVWVKGYIVGSVTDKDLSSAVFGATPASGTNILIAASAAETDITKCVPVQLPAGDVRTGLNLNDNPGNYKAEVTLKGNLEKYFGTAGVKTVTSYTVTGGSEVTPPDPAASSTFKAVTAITSGKSYVIVANGKMAKPIANNYGYLQVADVTVDGTTVKADEANAFVFTASGSGYTITQADGRIVYMTGSYNSFNVAADASEGQIWNVTFTDGAAVITNVEKSKTIQYDSTYNSYGAYSTVSGTYPVLYEKVD